MSEWDLMGTYEQSTMMVRRHSDLLADISGFCRSRSMVPGKFRAISGITQRELPNLNTSHLVLL